jgi:DNA topoisomerase VI subunit A
MRVRVMVRVGQHWDSVPSLRCVHIIRVEGRDTIDLRRCGVMGQSIDNDLLQYPDDLVFDVDPAVSFIILVEKECVFLRLTVSSIWDKFPCIVITGMGMPDYQTRFFLSLM